MVRGCLLGMGHQQKKYAFDSAYLVEKGLISMKKIMIIDFIVN
jgi:hypothetical protein